jgi:hypothetical protein
MSSDTTITIKNINILDLKRWLSVGLPAGILNRHRNEFIRILKPFADELENSRLEILKKYVIVEDGKQDLEKAEFLTPDDRKKAETEYDELILEAINITITKPAALNTIKQILKTSETKMGTSEGERFDEVCDALGIVFEDVKPEEKK